MKKLSFIAIMICAMFLSIASAKEMSLKVSNAEIDAYIEANPNLPDFDKSCLMSGEFKVGIQTGTLKLMLGEPKKASKVKQPWGEQEEWFYKVGKDKLYFMIENGGVVGIEER